MRARMLILAAAVVFVACGPATGRSANPITASGQALATTNTISENTISENSPGENSPGENSPGENTAGENSPGENTAGENSPGENSPGENTPGENRGGENSPGENTPGENRGGENGQGINNHHGSVDLDDILVSVDLSPAVLANGTVLYDVSVDGTALTGHHGGHTYSGADFVGARFVGTTGVGARVPVTVGAHGFDAPPNADLDTYFVTWGWDHAHHGPHAMCVDDSGNPLPAMPVYGYWDYTAGTATGGDKTESTSKITFACPDGAIGKCIGWGYRPWTSYNGVNLSPYHQACTRMTRADYCGDGTPHTVTGAWINLYDNIGLNTDDAHWVMEAQWDVNGATCLAPGGITDGGSAVSCYNRLVSSSCTPDDPNAMLTTETPTGARMTFPTEPPL